MCVQFGELILTFQFTMRMWKSALLVVVSGMRMVNTIEGARLVSLRKLGKAGRWKSVELTLTLTCR